MIVRSQLNSGAMYGWFSLCAEHHLQVCYFWSDRRGGCAYLWMCLTNQGNFAPSLVRRNVIPQWVLTRGGIVVALVTFGNSTRIISQLPSPVSSFPADHQSIIRWYPRESTKRLHRFWRGHLRSSCSLEKRFSGKRCCSNTTATSIGGHRYPE